MIPENNAHSQTEQSLLDQAEKLIWSLLDDQIQEQDVKRLEQLIEENEQVRLRYIQCAQVHADLYAQYQIRPSDQSKPQSPVLGTLLGDLSSSQGGSSSLVE